MPKPKPLPTQERLQELFDYSVTTGHLYRRQGRNQGLPVALQAKNSRYPTVWVDGRVCLVHRLVWVWVTGQDPASLHIDHIDRQGTNNAWHNLRLATVSQNLGNACRHRDNTSGFKGVYRDSESSRWVARITFHYKGIHLGYFDTPEEAHAAYMAAAERLHGEFARAA